MSVRARRLTVLLAILLALGGPVAVAVATTGVSGPTYRVRSGDTITSIALQLRLPGGWQQLYTANRQTIGADPNRLRVGEDLAIPQDAVPATEGYVVHAGDTLSSVASRLHVAGGGAALYAANKQVIGANPNRLEVGETLVPPGTVVAPNPPAGAPQPQAATLSGKSLTAQAPVAQGPAGGAASGGAATGTSGSNGHPVLWTAAAGVLFLLLVLLVLFALPRLRRSRGQDVWVGGDYSADNQPTPPTPASTPAPTPASTQASASPSTPPTAPTARTANSEGSVVTAFRPSSVSRSAEPPAEPIPASTASGRGSWFDRASAPAQDVRPERSRRPEAVSSPDRDLADELFGEVRLVDPSTPLTREQRARG